MLVNDSVAISPSAFHGLLDTKCTPADCHTTVEDATHWLSSIQTAPAFMPRAETTLLGLIECPDKSPPLDRTNLQSACTYMLECEHDWPKR